MKTKLLPLFFEESNAREKEEYDQQLSALTALYGDVAEFLPSCSVDCCQYPEADAVLFPQLIGAVFSKRDYLSRITLPVIVLTSSFGTVEMWDWEIVTYLREEIGLSVLSPYSTDLAKVILRAVSARKNMKAGMKFLMFQDDPGEGMQAYIFKRFYWWEKECTDQIQNTFGVQIIYKSWQELNQAANRISDEEALSLWATRRVPTTVTDITKILKAVKIYLAVKAVIRDIGDVQGVGSNCLNESFHSASTPCLAWNWLFEYDHILWACEGDIFVIAFARS